MCQFLGDQSENLRTHHKETTNKPLDQDPQNPLKHKAIYINGLYAIVSVSNQNV